MGVGLHSVVFVVVRGLLAVVVACERWHRVRDEHRREQLSADEGHRRVLDRRVSLGREPDGIRGRRWVRVALYETVVRVPATTRPAPSSTSAPPSPERRERFLLPERVRTWPARWPLPRSAGGDDRDAPAATAGVRVAADLGYLLARCVSPSSRRYPSRRRGTRLRSQGRSQPLAPQTASRSAAARCG